MLLVLGALVVCVVVILIRWWVQGSSGSWKRGDKYSHIPGPTGLPILGSALDVLRDNEKKCLQWAEEYGPVFKYKFLFWYMVIVVEPQAVKRVLVMNESNYSKNMFLYKLVADLVGHNLVTMTDVVAHKNLRNTLSEAFSYSNLKLYFPVFVNKAKELAAKWMCDIQHGNDIVDILTDFDLVTLDIIGRVGFASDFNSLKSDKSGNKSSGEHIHELVVTAFSTLGQPNIAQFVPFLRKFSPAWKTQMAATNELSKEMFDIVARKRELVLKEEQMDTTNYSSSPQKDLLDIFVTLKDENGEPLSIQSICEQSKMFLIAGHETSSSALTFMVYLLAKHPDIQQKLANEISENMQNKDDTNMESLDGLHYLAQFIKESMRLYPPAITMMRKCENYDTLGGYTIPAGTTVVINPYVVHNFSKNWENSSVFDPDRWGSNNEDSKSATGGAYIPFFLGSRSCIGSKFALLEMKAVLAVLVRKFTFNLHNECKNMKVTAIPTLRAVPRIQIRIASRGRQSERQHPSE